MVLKTRFADESMIAQIALIAQEIQSLHVALFPWKFREVSTAMLRERLEAQYRDEFSKFLVVENDDAIIGYAEILEVSRPENVICFATRYLSIEQFAVLERFQGKGAGTALLQAINDYAKGIGIQRIELDFWVANEKARDFYQKNGFTIFKSKMKLEL